MFELNYTIDDAEPQMYAAAPAITFKLGITAWESDQRIHNVLLQCQIQIEATRRRYNADEQQRLSDLFGEPDRWSQTLRTMLWTHANITVPGFEGATQVDLHIPCTFDFNVATTKYFHGLDGGEVPLTFLFSGSVFYAADDGALRVAQISWEKEAAYRLPAEVWQRMMDHYYPNTAWLSLQRDTFEKLRDYKTNEGLTSWEQALDRLLREPEPVVATATENT